MGNLNKRYLYICRLGQHVWNFSPSVCPSVRPSRSFSISYVSYTIIPRNMKLTQKIPLCMLIVATCLKFSSVRPSVRLSVRHEFLLSHISPTLLYLVMWNLHRRYFSACRLVKRVWNFPPTIRLSVRPSVCPLVISVISSYSIIPRNVKLTQKITVCKQIIETGLKFSLSLPSIRQIFLSSPMSLQYILAGPQEEAGKNHWGWTPHF